MEGKNYVEAIKLAVRFSADEGCDAECVLRGSIDWLYYKYMEEKDSRFLRQAFEHMKAYFEMGFSYEKAEDTFDELLKLAGTDIYSLIELNWQTGGIIRLNRSQIRRMIGRWSPHIHSMKINEVIDDIIDKVRNEKEGVFYYYSGQCKEKDGKVIPKNQYRLTVKNQRYEFFDITRKIYYTIKKQDKREKAYDSSSNSR